MGYVAPPPIDSPEFDAWLASRRRFNRFATVALAASAVMLLACMLVVALAGRSTP